jgi:pyruvate dehydrogenase E2 component (dihydrolipoamide acetyltransferase)
MAIVSHSNGPCVLRNHLKVASVMPLSRPAQCYSTTRTVFATDLPPHSLYPMPALSPTMETGSIAAWKLQEGESFGAGDALCTIETDKASVDFEAQDDGVLAKILVLPGVDVAIGTPICVVAEDVADVPQFANYSVPGASAGTVASTETAPSVEPLALSTPTVVNVPASAASGTSLLLPSARHLAESKGKDATVLAGSAKGGRVTKGDVLAALALGTLPDLAPKASLASSAPSSAAPLSTVPLPAAAAAAAPAPLVALDALVPEEISGQTVFEDIANSKMRKIIASRLTASKRDVPHSYASMEVSLDAVLALRKVWQNQHSIKVSVNDFIIRACALALRDVPHVNRTYNAATDTVSPQSSIDVSVAVATPTGLITPIVFSTDALGLSEISRRVADLAGRARDGKLQPHEYQGGTFSISNLGMYGISSFSAVINPPQAAILAVGGGTPTLVPAGKSILYDETVDTDAKSAPPTVQSIMTAQLSADRRVVDEATASLFLQTLRHYLQTPQLLML